MDKREELQRRGADLDKRINRLGPQIAELNRLRNDADAKQLRARETAEFRDEPDGQLLRKYPGMSDDELEAKKKDSREALRASLAADKSHSEFEAVPENMHLEARARALDDEREQLNEEQFILLEVLPDLKNFMSAATELFSLQAKLKQHLNHRYGNTSQCRWGSQMASSVLPMVIPGNSAHKRF